MRNFLIHSVTIIMANYLVAQVKLDKVPEDRKGFVIGLGVGGGALSLKTKDDLKHTFSTSLPNIKIGYMLNKRLALLALLPGANYRYDDKDRGFEGVTISGQYWIKNRWWVLSGAGLTIDAPAFYTVKDPKKAEFYTGIPAYALGTGYELWRKGRFAIDMQYRLFWGKSNTSNGEQRNGVANMFIIGFNWY